MRWIFASNVCLLGMIGAAMAADTTKDRSDIVGKLVVPDNALTADLSTSLAKGLCRYNGDRIICPYRRGEVVLTINEKADQ